MKNSFSTLASATFAVGLFLTAAASAQSIKTIDGDFKSSDGNQGTFVRTVSVTGTTTTTSTVFTRSSDKATSTNVDARTKNGDGTTTVSYSHTEFGATAAYKSLKTVTKEKHGQFVGKGTYTTATGDSGTVSLLENRDGPVDVTSNLHVSPTTGTTQILDLEDGEFGFSVDKHITLNPDGTVTTVVTTRYFSGSDSADSED